MTTVAAFLIINTLRENALVEEHIKTAAAAAAAG
jgi:hypothetical protein